MKRKWLLGFMILIASVNLFASAQNFKRDLTIRFDTGNTYEVSVNNDVLTWKGVNGDDKNTIEKVKVKRMDLAKNVEVYQWKEPRGYFVTFIVDTINKKGITSTKANEKQDWLVIGDITRLK